MGFVTSFTQPHFRPFVVVLHLGERLRVKNPDVMEVTLSGWVIYRDGAKAKMLNPALVGEIETQSANGQRNNQSVPRFPIRSAGSVWCGGSATLARAISAETGMLTMP